MSVNFATWVPKLMGGHVVKCSLSLAGDAEPSNDTMSGYAFVQAAGVAEAKAVPTQFRLEVPRPSVFSRSAGITFGLPHQAEVSLGVYDATGALVRQLRHGSMAAGEYRLTWDGRDATGRAVPAGAYFCRLEAGENRAVAALLKL